jgi:hypothetical protein
MAQMLHHIDVLRLLDLSRDKIVLDTDEQWHLRECDECQVLLRVFVRQQRALKEEPQDTAPDRKKLKETA